MGASIAFGNPQMRYTQVGGDIQNQLRYMQQRTRQQEQDVQSMNDKLRPQIEQKTIRDVIGQANQQGGTQYGLEAQQGLDKKYTDLQSAYDGQIAEHNKQSEIAAAKGLVTYDSGGNETTDKSNPELVALNDAKAATEAGYQSRLDALNKETTDRHAAQADFLDTVTSPKDAEDRLAKAMMAQGVNPAMARTQAKAEMAPYHAAGITDADKTRLEFKQKQYDTLSKTYDTVQTGNGANGGRTSSTKMSAGDLGFKDWTDSVNTLITDKGVSGGIFSGGDDKFDVKTTTSKLRAGYSHISDEAKLEATSALMNGQADAFLQYDPSMAPIDKIAALAEEIDARNGSTGKDRSFTNITKRGYSPEVKAQMKAVAADMDAILANGRQATVADALGEGITNFDTRNQGNLSTKQEEEVKKPKKGSTGGNTTLFDAVKAPTITKEMNSSVKGSLAKAISQNADTVSAFEKEYKTLSKTQQSSIDKVLSSSDSAKEVNKWGVDTATKDTTTVEEKIKSLKETLTPGETEFNPKYDSALDEETTQQETVERALQVRNADVMSDEEIAIGLTKHIEKRNGLVSPAIQEAANYYEKRAKSLKNTVARGAKGVYAAGIEAANLPTSVAAWAEKKFTGDSITGLDDGFFSKLNDSVDAEAMEVKKDLMSKTGLTSGEYDVGLMATMIVGGGAKSLLDTRKAKKGFSKLSNAFGGAKKEGGNIADDLISAISKKLSPVKRAKATRALKNLERRARKATTEAEKKDIRSEIQKVIRESILKKGREKFNLQGSGTGRSQRKISDILFSPTK